MYFLSEWLIGNIVPARKQLNNNSEMLRAFHINPLIHILVFLILTPSGLQGRTIGSHDQYVSSLCDEASRIASKEFGIPEQIMLAITRTETGRSHQGATYPWPWTVNLEGRGLWFDTQAEALAFVFDHFKTGTRNFDVGCFQINYRWHGAAFASIDQMFDPMANARYAASFLTSLYAKSGDWAAYSGVMRPPVPI